MLSKNYRSDCSVKEQSPEMFYKKDILKNSAKIKKNTCAGVSFASHLFYRRPPGDRLCSLLKYMSITEVS